jgi:hypothetical protein
MTRTTLPLAFLLLACSSTTETARAPAASPSADDPSGDPSSPSKGDDVQKTDPAAAGALCPKQTVEDGLVHCQEGYPEPPFVHVPASQTLADGSKQVVGGIAKYGAVIRDADGNQYTLPREIALTETNASGGNAGAELQADHLYRATVVNGAVTKIERFARIADAVFYTGWVGTTFEGVIAKRAGADTFETEPSLPVRVRFTALKDGTSPGASDHDPYKPQTLVATIENATAATKSSTGDCLASLASFGENNPDVGSEIDLGRYPTMHSAFDNAIVLTYAAKAADLPTNMAMALWRSPADLIAKTSSLPGAFDSVPHASPTYGVTMKVKPVTGGGGACTP